MANTIYQTQPHAARQQKQPNIQESVDGMFKLMFSGYRGKAGFCGSMTINSLVLPIITIIAALALAGVLPVSTAGWVILGAAALGIGSQLIAGVTTRKFSFISLTAIMATIAILGGLGASGILSVKQMGWAVIGLTIGFSCLLGYTDGCSAGIKAYKHLQKESSSSS